MLGIEPESVVSSFLAEAINPQQRAVVNDWVD